MTSTGASQSPVRKRFPLGQTVAFVLALVASALWLKLRPESPVGGAGGAIFPVLVVITFLYFAAAWLGPMLDETVFERARARRLRLERHARPFLREMSLLREKHAKRLSAGALQVMDAAAERLDRALEGPSDDELEAALAHAETVVHEQVGRRRKSLLRDYTESIGGALLIALALRLFVVEAFKIPSGSMVPTLAIGDHIFVNKFIYGVTIPFTNPPKKLFSLSEPKPGDVVVFVAPEPADNAGEDFIKRVIAVAGQKVQLRDGVLYVDGKAYTRDGGEDLSYRESSEFHSAWMDRKAKAYSEDINGLKHAVLYESYGMHDWPTYNPHLNGLECDDSGCTVQPGYIFCMGDNRDNSADSRKWGAVPLANVKGRAMFIWMSLDYGANPKGLPSIRWDRLGMGIH
ncbi:MAG: signal peptidase I [Myxococcota bacterium]